MDASILACRELGLYLGLLIGVSAQDTFGRHLVDDFPDHFGGNNNLDVDETDP